MKHQYFGDINDYRKYGILRILAAQKLRIVMCWMLTDGDNRTDGRHINYLKKPDKFRTYDPPLFDALQKAVQIDQERFIHRIHHHRLIPKAVYFDSVFSDDLDQRKNYFAAAARLARQSDLMFFDPDNGIEVKSKPKGSKDSCKYLYWDEIEQFWKLGHSLLIYQHFPRVNRTAFIQKLSRKLKTRTGAYEVIILLTSSVVFFLLPQLKHQKKISSAVSSIQSVWKGMIQVVLR